MTFPASLRTVAQGAFAECEKLKTARVNDGLEALGTDEYPDEGLLRGVFEGSAIEDVRLHPTLKRIEYRAFWGCERLKRVDLPERLEYLGSWCFCHSGILEIRLPRSLWEVGESMFGECPNLMTVEVEEGCTVDVRWSASDSVQMIQVPYIERKYQ